jgi:hypothetical protein
MGINLFRLCDKGLSEEKLTTNVLILELSTMIVAIALAFNAQSLTIRLTLGVLIDYVVVNIVVIWFWWRYIRDRFNYPIKTNHFPLYDVLLLIIISLVPEILRTSNIFYLSGTMATLAFLWALLLRSISKEYKNNLDIYSFKALKNQINMRSILGLMFLLSFVVSFISIIIGRLIFLLSLLIIAYSLIIGAVRIRIFKKKYHRKQK